MGPGGPHSPGCPRGPLWVPVPRQPVFCQCLLCARPTQPGIRGHHPQAPASFAGVLSCTSTVPPPSHRCHRSPLLHLSPALRPASRALGPVASWLEPLGAFFQPCSLHRIGHGLLLAGPRGLRSSEALVLSSLNSPKLCTLSSYSDALQGVHHTTRHSVFYFVFITCWDDSILDV